MMLYSIYMVGKGLLNRCVQIVKHYNFWLGGVFVYYFLSSLIYAILSIAKYNRYALLTGDLCVFNQGIWQYSQLKWPIIAFHLDKAFLSDHFHPILISIAPFYALFPGERTLLFIQPFIILSAMIPIFLITRHLTKSVLLGLALIFSYSFYLPIQYTIFYEFHEIIFLPPLFAWAYYFFLNNRKYLVAIFLILILLVKEELGFFVSAFGLYLLIFAKNWRVFGLIWLIAGTVYSLLIINIVIPAIGGNYRYLNYGASGNSPIEVFLNILKDPLSFLPLFFNSPVKQETLWRTFWPFGFLPLASPLGLLMSLEQFATRFFDLNTTNRWTIHYHYSAPMAIIAVIGTIETVGNISKRLRNHKRLFIILISCLLIILTRVEQINASAVLLAKRSEFWYEEQWMKDLDEAVTKVDNFSSVTAAKNIVCRLSSREKVYFFQDKKDMDYVILQSNTDDFKNNFTFDNANSIYYLKQKSEMIPYQVVWQKGQAYVFKKQLK